jgi:hypothetical protein
MLRSQKERRHKTMSSTYIVFHLREFVKFSICAQRAAKKLNGN